MWGRVGGSSRTPSSQRSPHIMSWLLAGPLPHLQFLPLPPPALVSKAYAESGRGLPDKTWRPPNLPWALRAIPLFLMSGTNVKFNSIIPGPVYKAGKEWTPSKCQWLRHWFYEYVHSWSFSLSSVVFKGRPDCRGENIGSEGGRWPARAARQ